MTGLLQDSIGSSETACRLQAQAADQIDAAQYALKRMMEELAAVLPSATAMAKVAAPAAEPTAEIRDVPAKPLAA